MSQFSRFLEPYRRVTSSGRFIPEIDGFRFLAITSVFIYHLAGDILRHSSSAEISVFQSSLLFSVTQVLNVGVPLFFTISGFILGIPFAARYLKSAEKVSLRRYFVRRLARLEPPYVLSLLCFFVMKILAAKGTALTLWPHLAASLLYLHNFIYRMPSDISIVAWSLEIEAQFYILAPVLALFFAIRGTAFRRTVLVVSIVAMTSISLIGGNNSIVRLSFLGYGQYFLAGFLLADLYVCGEGYRRRNRLCDLVASLAAICLLISLVVQGMAAPWLTPWLIAIFFAASFHGVIVNRLLTHPLITTIGGMCYSIYLLHNYLIAGLGMHSERLFGSSVFEVRLLMQFLLMGFVVLIVSAVYFRLIERPCMKPNWPRELKRSYAGWTFSLSSANKL